MTIFILKNLHWGYLLLFTGYLFAIIYRSVKVWSIYSIGRSYIGDNTGAMKWPPFDELFGQAQEAYENGITEAADNRIDEIWIQFQAQVGSYQETVKGYVNALILWGFAGTLFGSFMALFQMGETLTQPSVSARIAGTAGVLRDALSLAMLTSLLASVIGALAITFLCSGLQAKWVNGVASLLNDRIYRIFQVGSLKKT